MLDAKVAEINAEITVIDIKLAETEKVKDEVCTAILTDITDAIDISGRHITAAEIEKKAWEVALKIKENVDNGLIHNPLLLPVMVGGFDFGYLVHLHLKKLQCRHEYDCLLVESYDGIRAGKVNILCKSTNKFANRDIIILEDIVDTGATLHKVIGYIFNKNARSIAVACLTNKPDKCKFPIPIHYPTFTIKGDPFLIGTGMDYHAILRDLGYVGVVSKKTLDWIKQTGRDKILESVSELNQKKELLTNTLKKIESGKNWFSGLLAGTVFSKVQPALNKERAWVNTSNFMVAKM